MRRYAARLNGVWHNQASQGILDRAEAYCQSVDDGWEWMVPWRRGIAPDRVTAMRAAELALIV